jgi:hypothetical protein
MTFQWQDKEKRWDVLAFNQECKEQDDSVRFLDPNHPHVSSSEGH